MDLIDGTSKGKPFYHGRASIPLLKDRSSDILESSLPLTPIQREIISQINLRNESSYTSFTIPLPQDLSINADLLQHAWKAVASHNPILRTRVESSSSAFRQCTVRHILPIQFLNQEEEADSTRSDIACMIIALFNGKISASIRIHRALIDSLSLLFINRDFESFFNGVALERSVDLEKFICRTISRDENAAKLFWQAQLAGKVMAPIHGFPVESAKLSSQVSAVFGREETSKIGQFAASCGEFVQNVFYGAWAATLSAHTEAANRLATFAVIGRDTSHHESGHLTGPVDQIYPLTVDVMPKQSLKHFLRSIAQNESHMSRFAFIGYDAILEQAVELSGLTLVTVRTHWNEKFAELPCHHFGRFSVAVDVAVSEVITVTIQYSSSIDETEVKVLLDHYLSVIRTMIQVSASTVQDLTLISEAERGYLLKLAEPLTLPVEGLVHSLFEAQAAKTPDLPAVQFESQAPMSYSQLNSVANGVARQLKCEKGSFVPVCIQRSTNLIISLCAILKAGSAYVIADPAVPLQRNNFIYDDVSARFAIVDRSTKGSFPNEVLIEDLVGDVDSYDQHNLNIEQSPEDIVYVIYTSGSTGKPKGVLLEHRNAYSGLVAFPFIKDLRQLLFHNPVFSAAQRSIWSTLKQGGVLCLASKENLTVRIGETINSMRVNTIDVTPSTATLITPGSVPSLIRMTVAGELINPALVPVWVDRLELMNAYGLSENTQFNWRRRIKPRQNPQDIGRPIDTTTAFVLKPGTVELSPLLVPGELCLGGHQLARGYLNRPEKTKEVFIDNPFGPGRLYRTGDLVLTHANGSIEMIGRIDFSVKINDQRVDPGESNSTIQLHEHVKDSAVVAASISDRMALVAVVVHDGAFSKAQTLKEICERLESQLPRYMIPSYWTFREELPLNINGKVDVPALRKYCERLGRQGLETMSEPALDQLESRLTANHSVEENRILNLFSEALSIPPEEIKIDATFLSLGGTSLEAIKVASAALQAGLKIDPTQLLLQSISELAKSSSTQVQLKSEVTLKPFDLTPSDFDINHVEVEDVLPATSFQEGIIADSMRGKSDYMLPKIFRLKQISLSTLKEALQKVVDARPLLRTTIVPHNNSFVQVIRKHIRLPLRTLEQDPSTYLKLKKASPESIGLEEPLFRLISLEDNIVVIETHHVLVDSWSYHYIFDDLRTVLHGRKLEPRPSFANYIKYIATKDAGVSRDFWVSYLRGAQPTLLPTSNGGPVSANIELDHELGSFEHGYMSTASATFYAAWALTLSARLSLDDVVFIINVSGRETPVPEIVHLQGPTLSTVPMRVSLNNSSSISDLAQSIMTDFWNLAGHAYLGLRNIVRCSDVPVLANTDANYLISIDEPSESDAIEEMNLDHQNSNDLVTIEIDSKNPRLVKLFSNRGIDKADDILGDMKFVLETATRSSTDTIEKIRASIGPACVSRRPTGVHANGAGTSVQDRRTSLEPLSPGIRSVFDSSEKGSSRLSTTVSLGGTRDEQDDSSFGVWGSYMEKSEPTILEPSPSRSREIVQASIPYVKVHVAALKSRVSARTIIIAAFGIILNRHTGVNPLFGVMTSSTGDSAGSDEDKLYFIPQRVDASEASTLTHLIHTVHSNLSNKNSRLPAMRFDQAFEFAAGYSTAFDSFVCFRASREKESSAETAILPSTTRSSPYTILEVFVEESRVTFSLSSRTSQRRTQSIVEELCEVIQTAIVSPRVETRALNIIGSKERDILHGLARFRSPEPRLIQSYFERFASETPNAIALQFETSEVLTYSQLNERANKVARYMMRNGVYAGTVVPLYLEKSIEMIVAILAIVKIGAAYCPLSPDNSTKRNLLIMDEIKASRVVSQTRWAEFHDEHKIPTIFMDALPLLDHLEASNIEGGSVDLIAYCLFTSGSTGTPKGVSMSHRAISASLQGHMQAELTPSGAKHLLFANYTFDVSVHDIFLILGSGATLCVASTKSLMTDLSSVVNAMGITQTFLTPTVARLLHPDAVPKLRTLLCSGEALTTDIIDTWSNDRTLLNLYGPTECAVNVTAGYIEPTSKPNVLGKPLSTASVMIVERTSMDLAPLGAIGEICVAGPHLAQGYLNRPDLTSNAFISCPVPGTHRMYRTGDLGRWLPDMTIEYLGRIDHQIKHNGHRIELGEIEQVVLKSTLAQECVAVVLESLPRPQLAIFCVFGTSRKDGLQPPASLKMVQKLQASLTVLAHYMIPHYVFPVQRVLRSSANKTDRKALKQLVETLEPQTLSSYSLAAAQTERELAFVEVSSQEEHVLQSIWAQMFQVDKTIVGATSNFAVLGGDSISAINLASLCRKAGYKVDINDILTLGTLRNIALMMKKTNARESLQSTAAAEYRPPHVVHDLLEERGIEDEDVEYIYPCPSGQSEFLTQGSKKNQSWVVTAVRPVTTHHGAEEYLNLLQTLTRAHPILRTTFLYLPEYGWIGVTLKDPIINFSIRNCQPSEKNAIVAAIRRRRFSFGEPFVRYVVLSYPSGDRELVIKMDHALWDGTSLRIVDDTVRELQSTGSLPPQTPFADFIWAEYCGSKKSALEFWRPLVRASASFRPLITEKDNTGPQTERVYSHPIPVDIDATAVARTAGVTPATLFQALFQLWLAETKASDSASYDYLLTGRNVDLPDPQSIPGACANFLPFHIPVPRDGQLVKYLADTQAFFWQATKFGNVSLGEIYRDAGLEREDYGNMMLFLFQPFEQPPAEMRTDMRWLVMGLSQVHMPQPYELVEEVHKMAGNGYRIVIKYDGKRYTDEQVRSVAERQVEILRRVVERLGAWQHREVAVAVKDVL